MITVYLESNFVLECALQQEQYESCQTILGLARKGLIRLALPAFALIEPEIAIQSKSKARARIRDEFRAHMMELARSAAYMDLRERFEPLDSVLVRSSQAERASLRRVAAEVVSIGSVLPIDLNVLKLVSSIQDEHAMTMQDAVIFAAVLVDLEAIRPKVSCFLNRNTKDFDDPSVLAKLGEFGCRFFGRFDQGLSFVSKMV